MEYCEVNSGIVLCIKDMLHSSKSGSLEDVSGPYPIIFTG